MLIALPLWLRLRFIYHFKKDNAYESLQKLNQITLKILGFKLVSHNAQSIPKNQAVLFISNHQGTIDPLLVVGSSSVPLAFISKEENAKLPIFGLASKILGTIHFNRETREGNIYMLRESVRRIKQGGSLLIFPEGTRSKSEQMGEFKEGAFQVALMAKVPIVPVTLQNAHCINTKSKNKVLTVTYGTPIPFEDYKGRSLKEISDMVYHEIEKVLIQAK